MVSFDTEPEKADAAREAVLKEVAKLVDDGVSDRELEKARRQVLSAQFSTFTDMRGQASDIGSNWLFARNPDHTRDYVEAVQRVTIEAVREVAEQWLRPDRLTSVALLPKAPSKAAGSAGAAKRSEDIRRIELANGLTVLLLEDHRVPFVQATGVFRGGLLAETEATAGLTRLMARLLTKDTRKRSAEELALEIESVGGGIGSSTGNNTFGVSVNALRPDLERVVDWLGETLLEPAFLPEVVEREKSFQIAQIKAEADRPFSVAMKALRRRLYGTHSLWTRVHGNPGITWFDGSGNDRGDAPAPPHRWQRSRRGLRRSRSGAGRGDDPLAFRACPGGGSARVHPAGVFPARGLCRHDRSHARKGAGRAPDRLSHRRSASSGQSGPRDDRRGLQRHGLAPFIRIREKLGLAYSVGATRMVGLEPGFLVFYVSTSPEKLDLVQEEMLSEVDLIVREGLEAEEFERAKASWLGREAIHLQGVRELASTAAVDELVGLGWDHYRKTPATVASLTRDRVREAAERHLREDNRVIVRLTK